MPLAQALDMFLYPVLAQDISHKPRVCLNNEDVVVTWYSLTELLEISIKMKFIVCSRYKTYESLSMMTFPCSNHGFAVCGGLLYVMGGGNPNGSVCCFIPRK